MKTLLYANRAEPKSISVISILLLAAVGAITKLRCMHRECYIFASQNLCYNCLCGSVAKASDTQAVGHGFEPRPDH